MATIQIRDIPEEAYETMRRRARAQGKSIQSYMREQVVDCAGRQTKAEALARVEAALAGETTGARAEDIATDLSTDRR